MMTRERELLQQALDALTNCLSEHGHRCNRCDSEIDEGGKLITALREALAAPEPEPYAHLVVIKTDAGPTKFFTAPSDPRGFPVYLAPPAAPEQEPVALESVHLTRDTRGMCVVRVNGRIAIRDNGDIIDHMATLEWFAAPPAAPAPAQPVPLTQDQIADCTRTAHRACDAKAMTRWSTEFARAIEAAHGIKGQ